MFASWNEIASDHEISLPLTRTSGGGGGGGGESGFAMRMHRDSCGVDDISRDAAATVVPCPCDSQLGDLKHTVHGGLRDFYGYTFCFLFFVRRSHRNHPCGERGGSLPIATLC